MSQPIAIYSFLPWLRQGLANKITASGDLRATIPVELTLSGSQTGGGELSVPIQRDVQLFGPGDILGIDSKAVIKTDPRNWITNFEPNYLPYIDFYEEDMPWRYTPAIPDKILHRLPPWIMLVVLKEGEFEEGSNVLNKPLPFIQVPDALTTFPPADQLWAWAHVHANTDLSDSEEQIVTTGVDNVLIRLQNALQKNPDIAYSRILCPRLLEPNAAYHAFLVPAFESGRLAGLGRDPSATPSAAHIAWATYADRTNQEPTFYPYYYRWYFRTGTIGDFEYLVRLLEPKTADSRVGRRDLDVQEPDANIHGIDDPELGGVLKLGGALQVPYITLSEEEQDVVDLYENWDHNYPRPFQDDLARLINLSDSYQSKTVQDTHADPKLPPELQGDADPLITPPLYGHWHANVERLLFDQDGSDLNPNRNWVHNLNLDPRFRVAAGFGTKVIQDNQEKYMEAAWKQVGDVLEANRKLRAAQLGAAVNARWYLRHIRSLEVARPEKAFLVTAPLHRRLLVKDATVSYQVSTSLMTSAMVSPATRRMLRPGGRLARALLSAPVAGGASLLARANAGEIAAAPPKVTPEGAVKVSDIVPQLLPSDAPQPVIDLLRKYPWLVYLPLALAVLFILLLLFIAPVILTILLGLVALAAGRAITLRLLDWQRSVRAADSLLEENQTPAAVDQLPKSPDFRLSSPDEDFTPTTGAIDSPEAVRFKSALKDVYIMQQASRNAAVRPPRESLDLPGMTSAVVEQINPIFTIPRRILGTIALPDYILRPVRLPLAEVLVYPEIDEPMYAPLTAISSEYFVPNLQYITPNSISLLETNQKFIEAYMVGLNHEFSREILWREYPSTLRGSTFRQFWDVKGYLSTEDLDNKQLREKLKDIPPIHTWSSATTLGQHDNRETGGDEEEELVLVIRGELLKKYPTAVIYAHRADWERNADNSIDNTRPRKLVELTPQEEAKPPRDKVKTPLYEAKVAPDIYFFGFDLKAETARGGTGEDPNDDPGWFFVIQERPGEPRFGMDLSKQGARNTWNELTWEDALPGGVPGDFIQITPATPTLTLTFPSGSTATDAEKKQHKMDKNVVWGPNTNSADLAYILYQAPVMVGVHAAEMLRQL